MTELPKHPLESVKAGDIAAPERQKEGFCPVLVTQLQDSALKKDCVCYKRHFQYFCGTFSLQMIPNCTV